MNSLNSTIQSPIAGEEIGEGPLYWIERSTLLFDLALTLLCVPTEGNRGVVIKPWNWDHHAFYNLKDYYSYRHQQDPDLVLDYQNSDLVF